MSPTRRLARPHDFRKGASARIRNFYLAVLTDAEKDVYEIARQMDGLDNEIATLRVKIRTAAANDDTLALMLRGIEVLARLLGKRYDLPAESVTELAEAMRASLEEAVPARTGDAVPTATLDVAPTLSAPALIKGGAHD